MSEGEGQVKAVAEALNTKAVEKLAGAVQGVVGIVDNIVDYIAGPTRIANVGRSRAQALYHKGSAEIKLDELRQQAAGRLLDKELRNQANIQAIVREAMRALPPPEEKISDEPVSEDFVYRFFDECQGIGNEEMQQLWGRLLAGEVATPGSFHPKTLSTVKDMNTHDAQLFALLCRYKSSLGPHVYELENPLYQSHGLTYDKVSHLESLGLIQHVPIGGYLKNISSLPNTARLISYFGHHIAVMMNESGGASIQSGVVIFTEAGKQVATLFQPEPIPGFYEYLVAKWRADGVNIVSSS